LSCEGNTSLPCASYATIESNLPEMIDRVLNGAMKPGKVFDLTLPLDQVAEGYRAVDDRRAIKTLLRP
jgi:threonine dehydrogenase-like Zn-dependent dehydrogenase